MLYSLVGSGTWSVSTYGSSGYRLLKYTVFIVSESHSDKLLSTKVIGTNVQSIQIIPFKDIL